MPRTRTLANKIAARAAREKIFQRGRNNAIPLSARTKVHIVSLDRIHPRVDRGVVAKNGDVDVSVWFRASLNGHLTEVSI